jgi:hypothetical protein
MTTRAQILKMKDLSIEIVEHMRPVSKPGPHITHKTYKESGGYSAYYPVRDWGYTSCTLPTQTEAIEWLIAKHRLAQAKIPPAKIPPKEYVQLSLFEIRTVNQ